LGIDILLGARVWSGGVVELTLGAFLMERNLGLMEDTLAHNEEEF